MFNEILLIVVILYVVFFEAIGGYLLTQRLTKVSITEGRRIKVYQSTILNGWASVAFVIGIIVFSDITTTNIGLKMMSFNFKYFNIWISIVILVVCFCFMLLLIYQIVAFKLSEEYRKKLDAQLKSKPMEKSLDMLLPKTKREKIWWSVVSLTAGIGEEIFYRGFVLYLLISFIPDFSIYFILIAASLIFGIAHCYQGFAGFLKTGLMGLMFCAIYFITGSIIPGMLIHFLMDFASNYLFEDQPQ